MFGNTQHALQLLLNMCEVIMEPFGWTIEFNFFYLFTQLNSILF